MRIPPREAQMERHISAAGITAKKVPPEVAQQLWRRMSTHFCGGARFDYERCASVIGSIEVPMTNIEPELAHKLPKELDKYPALFVFFMDHYDEQPVWQLSSRYDVELLVEEVLFPLGVIDFDCTFLLCYDDIGGLHMCGTAFNWAHPT
jgi:hypothetical protein